MNIINTIKKDFGKNVLITKNGKISVLLTQKEFESLNWLELVYMYKHYFNLELKPQIELYTSLMWRITFN